MSMISHTVLASAANLVATPAVSPPQRREPRKRRWDRVPDLADAPDELLLAPSEVAALSGIAEVTWRLWRKQSRGPVWRMVEGMPRLTMGAYREWLAKAA